ncbi:ABC transporter ATP-binding protein, partial [Aeromicrobium sp.]|uniref:ABC transporter ATP-binding protein n=1 Tax=Aeromicrobium sp. TaxID=1871063 RepID=UPI003C6A9F4D
MSEQTHAESGTDTNVVLKDTSDHDQIAIEASGEVGEVLLEVDHVTLRFGGVVALNDVNFEIRRGEILGLIGPNGAGKTTAFNAMTGVYTPTEGAIRFKGKEIAGTKPHKINHLGIARTFQNIRLFPEMSAMENVMVGCDARHKTSVVGVLFRTYRVRPAEKDLPESGIRRSLAKVFGISRHTL